MRRALATVVGALALTGALSVPAHADDIGAPVHADKPVTGIAGVLGHPVKAASDIAGLRFGELPWPVPSQR
ncbi:hypothetical protein FCH28_33570 [Streptomyces piniterrae]|uniref:Carboxylesterase family protein n=1 Tax=Streptomyces piniterrae TaxID=2571125 RepID=A0A4U0MPZ7_9ACTN|nr:hypothetical protein [Streptomyces piniterrae]TJZ42823.1 hypothetical protein FCH28_33570 [Streptomyces piniterrae]